MTEDEKVFYYVRVGNSGKIAERWEGTESRWADGRDN